MRLLHYFRAAFVVLLLMTLLLGGLYPLLTTLVAQTLFPREARGSLIVRDEKIIGSSLLGQAFTKEGYFWGRPSATTPPYNAASSSGSNFAPANPRYLDGINARLAELQKPDPANKMRVPIDLLTASASGLDPDISYGAALYQIPRVAKARGMSKTELEALVTHHRQEKLLDFVGADRVNVLQLNLALDEQAAQDHTGK